MSRISTILLAFASLAVAGCVGEGSKKLELMGEVDTSAMITLQEAIEIGLGEVPGGFAVEAELEIEDDDGEEEPPAYEVVYYVPTTSELIEVEIHAFTGDVLEVEVEDDDDGPDDD